MTNPTSNGMLGLELAVENAELRARLAEAREQRVELAIDAGELHAEVEALRVQLSLVERDRNAWRGCAYRTVWALAG